MHDVQVASSEDGDGRVFVTSKCWASQKKTTKYCQKVIFSPDSDVEKKKESPVFKVDFATCQVCPAGQQGGLCQHVFALLMVIEEYRPREAVPTLPTAEPVTSIRRS